MSREMDDLIKYIGNEMVIPCKEDKLVFERCIGSDFLRHAKVFERPDIICNLGNQLLAIEHFEFDASFADKKGSSEKREESSQSKLFEKEIAQLSPEKPLITHTDKYDTQYSAENYIKNFKRNFDEHYNKVDEYKENVVKTGLVSSADDILLAFFIVDTTALGSFYIMKTGLRYVAPCFVPECLDIMQNARCVDYYFLGSYTGNRNVMNFICNRDSSLNYIRENYKSDGDWEFWEPHTTRFATL